MDRRARLHRALDAVLDAGVGRGRDVSGYDPGGSEYRRLKRVYLECLQNIKEVKADLQADWPPDKRKRKESELVALQGQAKRLSKELDV